VFKTEIEAELTIEECQKLEIIMAKHGYKTIQQALETLIKEAYKNTNQK